MSFWKGVEDIFNQGVSISKEAFDKAKEKAKELGDKGVIKLEITQLEREASKKSLELGRKVYELLVKEGKNTVSKSTPGIKDLIEDLKDLEARVDKKEKELKKLQ